MGQEAKTTHDAKKSHDAKKILLTRRARQFRHLAFLVTVAHSVPPFSARAKTFSSPVRNFCATFVRQTSENLLTCLSGHRTPSPRNSAQGRLGEGAESLVPLVPLRPQVLAVSPRPRSVASFVPGVSPPGGQPVPRVQSRPLLGILAITTIVDQGLILQNKLVKSPTHWRQIGYEIKEPPPSTEEIVDKSIDSYKLPEVKLFRIDNDGQLPRMTTRQTTAEATTAVPSEDIPSRMAHLKVQIQEVKDLLVTLTAAQTRTPSTPPVDAPIPTVEAAGQRTPRTRNTPETTEQARNLFDNLQMGENGHTSETFPEFKARFQSAAITGQVSESEWFRYMWNKLTPQFRSHVTIIKNQWNGDYQTMTSASKPTRATPALFTRTTFLPSQRCRMKTAVPASSGNCFKCGKPSHFQDKCPLNDTIKEIDRNDPEAEEQWEEAVELQSDVSLEENDEA
ncbi:hypothetical protein GMDG_03689 [Pseudogymnoascus destructans 20631-21]|uniref:CCHC-type domain-containing protein n=1 Tax=Pseudogymnoascus destructans (strain ATCC MYA-4855 / 20631-21) TaxID=658429 RepID=L8G7D4_PSED2|nr:hypothetical protein GMDG_03689 [Pseudogymnoascus destructans 20631-21]